MGKEPYEKPAVTTIDLGNLIDEGEKLAARGIEKSAEIRLRMEGIACELEEAAAELEDARRWLAEAKKRHLVAQTALELQERMIIHEQEPPRS